MYLLAHVRSPGKYEGAIKEEGILLAKVIHYRFFGTQFPYVLQLSSTYF